MKLSDAEREQFFGIWARLLAYVNDMHHVSPKFGHPKNMETTAQEVSTPIRNKLWEDDSIIDAYIASSPRMSDEEATILRLWKNRVEGKFVILRHLKNYTVFFDMDSRIFGVRGLRHPLDAFYPDKILPILVEAVLLPFKGKIIYDTLLTVYNIRIGGGLRKVFNDDYLKVKKESGIITQFAD
ncbi:MAG: hypothetical protein Ta2A_01060 [Treponemataceae bacterium]|nr:MAG: hypothetical protein Ta2A_01060 [Treponemataceae bacterium]